MIRRNRYIILCLLAGNTVFAQKFPLRNVVLNQVDSIIRCTIIDQKEKQETDATRSYTWYWSDRVDMTQGGYNGYLLHGEYRVTRPGHQPIASGSFDKGLKDGTWKHWGHRGHLVSLQQWDKGYKTGEWLYYSSEGNIQKVLHYHNGVLHGDAIYFHNGQKMVKTFKNGEEILPESNVETDTSGARKPFFLFWKKDKEQPASSTENVTKEKEEKGKKEKNNSRKEKRKKEKKESDET